MLKRITFCFALYTLVVYCNSARAQQEHGQIIINAGVGYSPGFNGDLGYASYPVPTVFGSFSNWTNDEPRPFICSSIIPNIGGAMDFAIINWISGGLAVSYQNEVVNWSPLAGPSGYPFSDKISRINLCCRILFHLIKENRHIDLYTGIRLGASLWYDLKSSENIVPPGFYGNGYFLVTPNLAVPSFQALIGLRYYPIKCIGLHIEAGIGTPYLAEGGLSFRINTHKEESTQPASPPDNYKK